MTLPRPKAVLFDWDDTIVDNWHTAFAAINTTLEHMGHAPWSVEECRRRSGPSARDLFTQLFGEDRWQEADRVYYATFLDLVMKNAATHDGALDVLNMLSRNGVVMGVVSNKRNPLLKQEIENIGLGHYFPVVIAAGEASADKPDPAPILLALEQSAVTPGPDVWYIGDSHTDMMSARRAGCSAVLIETKTPPEDLMRDHPPHARFKGHAEILAAVSGLF
jgi:phosphoglycolate phosphatase